MYSDLQLTTDPAILTFHTKQANLMTIWFGFNRYAFNCYQNTPNVIHFTLNLWGRFNDYTVNIFDVVVSCENYCIYLQKYTFKI